MHDLEPRVDNAGTASIQDAERTFSLMNYFSNSLGTNCTYCHNTRALHDIDQATPQLAQAQLGIGMALELNNDYLLPLGDVLPPNRLGALHADAPKVGCATCHKGQPKPLEGLNVIADWPELSDLRAARLRMTGAARPPAGAATEPGEARDVTRVRSPEDPAARPRAQPRRPAPHVGRRTRRRRGRTARRS